MHYLIRTQSATQGRKPKLKGTLELCTPVFIEDKNGGLTMGDNLKLIAHALDLVDKLA